MCTRKARRRLSTRFPYPPDIQHIQLARRRRGEKLYADAWAANDMTKTKKMCRGGGRCDGNFADSSLAGATVPISRSPL
jgi:hypothetical protein